MGELTKEIIFKEIDRLKENLISDLREVIRIPSKRSESTEEYPYGVECARVLDKALEIAKREGFSTKNVDYHMAYASIGNSDNYICAMGHLDVVEELSGWDYPPFEGVIDNNRMYARGALDNKGPIMSAFYGLIALKNLGVEFNTQFRIVFGSNEETGMNDLRYYLTKEKPPVFGFTPDNKFPAIYGERGRARVSVEGEYSKVEKFINEKLFIGDAVKNLKIDFQDDDFGRMILRNPQLSKNENTYKVIFSLSLPRCDIEKVLENIRKNAFSLDVKLVSYDDCMLRDKNSKYVKLLNSIYNEVMGEDREPTTTTGMTYAHFCPNLIPFGPSFPGQNGIAHLPNEWMDIDDLINCAKIYAYTFYRLNKEIGENI